MAISLKGTMKVVASAVLCAGLACALFGCSSQDNAASQDASQGENAVQLQIFAANSLEKAMNEVQAVYTDETGVTFVDTQYKGSGDLVKDLEGGAPCDILITASKSTMDDSVAGGYVDESSRFDMFTNDLVLVAGVGNDNVPADLVLEEAVSGKYTMALGNDNVPAGNYARQSISTIVPCATIDGKQGAETDGKIGSVEGEGFAGTDLEGKVVPANSVGDACNYAATGDADIAFVYTSDVARYQDKVVQLSVVPADTHKNIVYPAAVSADTENAEAAQAFLDWATSNPEALKIWQKWGFELAA